MNRQVVILTSMLVGLNLRVGPVLIVEFRGTKKLHVRHGCRRNRQLRDGWSLPVKKWVRRIAAA